MGLIGVELFCILSLWKITQTVILQRWSLVTFAVVIVEYRFELNPFGSYFFVRCSFMHCVADSGCFGGTCGGRHVGSWFGSGGWGLGSEQKFGPAHCAARIEHFPIFAHAEERKTPSTRFFGHDSAPQSRRVTRIGGNDANKLSGAP